MTHATSGLMSPEPLAVYDPASSCWRTFGGMFPSDSMPSLATFPASGMTRGGELYELPTPEPHMGEPASSSAPGLLNTPTAADAIRWKVSDNARENFGATTLGEQVTLLATPRTTDGNGAGHHGDGGMDLRTQVLLLPTPSAQEVGYAGELVAKDGSSLDHLARRAYHPETGRVVQTGLPQVLRLLFRGDPTSSPSDAGSTSSDE